MITRSFRYIFCRSFGNVRCFFTSFPSTFLISISLRSHKQSLSDIMEDKTNDQEKLRVSWKKVKPVYPMSTSSETIIRASGRIRGVLNDKHIDRLDPVVRRRL